MSRYTVVGFVVGLLVGCASAFGAMRLGSVDPATWELKYVPLHLLAGVGAIYVPAVLIALGFFWDSKLSHSLRDNGSFSFGLPLAAVGDYCIVFLFPITPHDKGERIAAKLIGIELEGPACQAVLWMLCYIVMIWSAWLVWNKGENN